MRGRRSYGGQASQAARGAMLDDTSSSAEEQEALDDIMNAGGDDEDEEDQDGKEDDAELVDLLKHEAANSIGMDGDVIASEQVAAFERYIGKDYGDEAEGQSRVHTREVFETIEWIRPDCARIFAAGSGALEVEAWEPELPEGATPEQAKVAEDQAQKQAEQATTLLQALFFRKQPGDETVTGLALVDGFLFDGLLQKIGVIAVRYEDEQMGPPEHYTGLNLLQAQQLANEKDKFEVIGGGEDGTDEESGEPTYTIIAQKVRCKAQPVMDLVAPEDFRCSKRAVSLGRPFYCGYDLHVAMSYVIGMFPDDEDEIREFADASRERMDTDERRSARFLLDEEGADARISREDGDDIVLSIEYVYRDRNDDGYPELLECWRMGDLLLSAEEADENCFAAWSPIRIPHKLVGMSYADITSGLQRTNTVLMRSALDASMLAVAPRTVVSNAVNLVDLLTVRPGSIIRLNEKATGMPGEHVFPLVTPDVAGSALKMMDKIETQLETRTGVMKHDQGLNPDTLHKTMGGAAIQENRTAGRKEMLLRNMADGLEAALTKFLRLLIRHGDKQQKVKIGKQWQTIDISGWSPSACVKVNVGQGAGNRQAQLANLAMIDQKQTAIVERMGVDNPFVTPAQQHNTWEQIVRAMGFPSADPFFTDPKSIPPDKLAAALQPKPDPKLQAAMETIKVQMAKIQAQSQADREKLIQAGVLKREEIAAEVQSDREQLSAEVMLAREENQTDAIVSVATAGASKANGADTRVGGDKV